MIGTTTLIISANKTNITTNTVITKTYTELPTILWEIIGLGAGGLLVGFFLSLGITRCCLKPLEKGH